MPEAQDKMFAVFQNIHGLLMDDIMALKKEFHEHGPDCEMRCPRDDRLESLHRLADDIGDAFAPYFTK